MNGTLLKDLGCGGSPSGHHRGECSAAGAVAGARTSGERSAIHTPDFLRHWIYIVIVLGMFAGLCFGFAPELAGASALGRFLSGFLAGFWLPRFVLQVFYYDREIRRENRGLDMLYVASLIVLVLIFGRPALKPVA